MSVAITKLDGFDTHGVRLRWMRRDRLHPYPEQWLESEQLFPTEVDARAFAQTLNESDVAHITLQGRML